jgi:hypothetical protein
MIATRWKLRLVRRNKRIVKYLILRVKRISAPGSCAGRELMQRKNPAELVYGNASNAPETRRAPSGYAARVRLAHLIYAYRTN